MADELLKGNFKVKRKPTQKTEPELRSASKRIAVDLKKKALGALGGSMVFVDRTALDWDGDSESRS